MKVAAVPAQRGRSVANESKEMARKQIRIGGELVDVIDGPPPSAHELAEARKLNAETEARMEARKKAHAQSRGETYVAPASAAPNIGPANGPALVKLGWRREIMQSPDAKGRESAVAEILVKHSPETLSADNARAFLRGLPTEQSDKPKATNMTTNTDDDDRAARKAEIAQSVQSFNRDKGYAVKPLAPEHARVLAARAERDNPAMLKRKAEIRLAALAERDGSKRSEEVKNLAYAIQVHEQTGKPLAQAFASCGVDVSKFMG